MDGNWPFIHINWRKDFHAMLGDPSKRTISPKAPYQYDPVWYHTIAIKVPNTSRRHVRIDNPVTHQRFLSHSLVLQFTCIQLVFDGGPVDTVPHRAETAICHTEVIVVRDTGLENGRQGGYFQRVCGAEGGIELI